MSPDASPTAVDVAAYTTLHLAATSFVYPPNAPDIRHCACKSTTIAEATPEQSKHVRVYHTEPSVFAYNQGSYVIRETRFSTEQGWHAPNDDLVADDAMFGSPVASIGWWVIGDQGSSKIWQSRVYYIDNTGKLRERTNWSEFTPEVKETFDEPLPDPGSLVPPVPGWVLTPISESAFPSITPLPTSKLAAIKTEDNKIHIFYQAIDGSVEELIWGPGLPNAGWVVGETKVVGAGKAKQGTPLAAITGGWTEVRVFYVGTTDLLSASYTDEHVQWQPVDVPPYSVSPTAMLTAVAWNYASPYFEMRIYSTDDKDELYEISYSRNSGGWAPLLHSVSTPDPGAFSPASRSGVPLSAVAGVIVDDSWVTKVYFHPRRVIGEWDLCTKAATFNGVPKQSETAAAKRRTEEETRKKIKEEEDRRAEEERARQEAERKAKEEEEARKAEEEARKAKEEEERKANELPNDVTLANPIAIVGSLDGNHGTIDDEFYKVELSFPVTLYGYQSSTLWVTDNGTICLDKSTNSRAKRIGQPLPYHDGMPDYCIFPFWTDLLIVQGKPHGVYYEITGQAPNRVLTVEWYVTRYGQEDQYFHFTVQMEEAKPGVVGMHFYDAVDQGAQCTVGVQGPGNYLQFSHNEPKINPGLQLTFDTNTNSMSAVI